MLRAVRELSAGLGVFVSLGVSIAAEYFAAAHVIVAVSAAVRVILQRRVFRLMHRPPPVWSLRHL